MNQCVLRRRGLSLPSLQQPVTLSVIYARRSVVETVVRQFVHETTTSYCSADSVRPHRCCHLPNNLKLPPDVSYTSQWVNNRPHLCAACRVQALTAEANMESTKSKEDKEEIVQLRNEIYAWKQKYYDCRRKVVAVAQ